MSLLVSSTCAHHQEVKIALHSLWYHHTYTCDDTRGCVMQFWPPDDEHMCSKQVEIWNKLIVRPKCYGSSWLITEINKIVYLLFCKFTLHVSCVNYTNVAKAKLAWPRWREAAAQKIWPVPEAVVAVLCNPDDGCGWHPKHVEWTCRIINRLPCVASRWTIINIDNRCTEP